MKSNKSYQNRMFIEQKVNNQYIISNKHKKLQGGKYNEIYV